MRLFTAITFPEEVKRKLTDIQQMLKSGSLRGNFTNDENLHLTLVFLGEVAPNRVGLVQNAIANSPFSSFELTMKGVGRFKREGGDIVWVGIDMSKDLSTLHARLAEQLAAAGFTLEERGFKPHLTLAREVKFREDFDLAGFSHGLEEIHTLVSKISLMKSERLSGKLTYTQIKGA